MSEDELAGRMNERDELGGRMNELARASARDDSLYATKVVCIPPYLVVASVSPSEFHRHLRGDEHREKATRHHPNPFDIQKSLLATCATLPTRLTNRTRTRR